MTCPISTDSSSLGQYFWNPVYGSILRYNLVPSRIGKRSSFRYRKTDIGKATGTSIGKGKAKGRKFEPGQEFGLSGNYKAGDIGKVKDFSKKGQYKITDVKTDAGTAGSYGGYSSAKEYMDALNKGGSPKMPKGPMKFGMKK